MAVWALSSLYEYAVGKLRYSSGMKVYLSNCCETDGTLKKQMRLKFKVLSSKKAPMAKRISLLVCVVLTLNLGHVMAQGVGIGTTTFSPVSDALLELRSTTSGLLMPRMTMAQRNAITSPSVGLMIYQTNSTPGFYYYNGTSWVSFGADNLGTHSASQKLVMNGFSIANASGSDGIRLQDNGNVSIGASVPAEKLQVDGSIILTRDANRTISIAAEPSTSTAVPAKNLTIRAAHAASDNFSFAQRGGDLILQGGNGYTNTVPNSHGGHVIIRSGANHYSGGSQKNGGDIIFETGGSANAFTERIRILDNGNMGMGVAGPTEKLVVAAGNIQVSSGSGSAYGIKLQNPAGTFTTTLKAGAQTANLVYTLPVAAPTAGQVLSSNGTGTLSWVNNGSGWGLTGNGGITASTAAIGSAVNNNFLGTTDAKDLVFATNSRERFRVTSAGNLGIGTLAPGRLLHVVGGDNSSSVDVATTNILAQVENTTNNGSVVFNIQAKNPTNTFSSRLGINPTYDVGGVGPGVYTWYAGMNGTNKQLMMYDFINANLHFAPSSAVINNIAIGLCQPTIGSKLTVNGNLAISNGTGSYTTTAAPAGGAIIEGNVGIGTNSPGQRLQVADGNILLSRTGGSAGEIRFQGTSSGVTAFKAGAQGATNITYTLPVTAPSAGQVLSSNGTGTLSWVSNGGGWGLTGTSGTTASTASIGSAVNNNFMGTTDSKDLVMATNNRERLRISSNGNVGLGTTTPSTTLDVNGSVAYKRNNVTCANGVNSNLNVGNYSFIKISGPTAAFSITGITGGVDGRIVTLYNSTGQNMTITNDATSTAANRVLTLTGASIATSGTGTVTLQYDSASSRWIVIALQL